MILEDLAKTEGFELRTFAVPAPGVEMAAQVLDITGRFKPDFVIAHLFGRAPSVAIKELKGKGYPLSKVIGFVWASSEADIEAAGGYGVAEGYHTIQFAGVGTDFQVIKDIDAMYKAQGKSASEGAGNQRLLQSRRDGRRHSRRGDPQRHQGQGRRQADRRGREEGHGGRSRTSRSAAWCLRWRSTPRTTRAAAGCRCGPSRAASSSRTASGSRPTAT